MATFNNSAYLSTMNDYVIGAGSSFITEGGNLNLTATTQSTSTSTGSLTVAGGAGIGKNLYVGGNLNVTGTITGSGVGGIGSIGIGKKDSITAFTTSNAAINISAFSGNLTSTGGAIIVADTGNYKITVGTTIIKSTTDFTYNLGYEKNGTTFTMSANYPGAGSAGIADYNNAQDFWYAALTSGDYIKPAIKASSTTANSNNLRLVVEKVS